MTDSIGHLEPTRFARVRPLLCNLAVLCLSLIAIAFSLSDIVVSWHPYGVVGLILKPDATVVYVFPHSHAEQAGIHAGDRIDFAKLSPINRLSFNGTVFFASADAAYPFAIISPNGVRRSVSVRVEVPPRSFADNFSNAIECLSNFVSIVLAGILVVVRPSRVTWAFFLFMLLSIGVAATPTTLGVLTFSAMTACIGSLTALAWIPLAIFAIRFPHNAPNKIGRGIERALLGSLLFLIPYALYGTLAALGVIPLAVYVSIKNDIGAGPFYLPPFGLLLAAVLFAASYRAANSADRTRMRWVIVGFIAGYSGSVVQRFLFSQNFSGLLWVSNLLAASPVFAAVAVTYAIVRHRVLDVRIVVGRAAVYAALTAVVVALIAVFDFFVSKVFAGTKIAAFGEIGVAVVLGLALNPLHRRLERAVDGAIFRRRRLGEQRLRLVADGLIHANETTTIAHVIVNQSLEAFGLASVAIFEVNESGDYSLSDSVGWEKAARLLIERESALVLLLIAAGAPLRLTPADVAALPDVPVDEQASALAVPIIFRGALDGILLFGAHRNGEEIDSEEVASLWNLARAAASAFDHLDAQSMRVELAAFRASLQSRSNA